MPSRSRSGEASGVDILDGFKFQFGPTQCGRSEATFNDAEGAFVANVDGPVRAIRAYVGANSGPLTERTDVFWPDRHEIITDLRVHSGIPGPMIYHDLSDAGLGMTYLRRHQPGRRRRRRRPRHARAGTAQLATVDRSAGIARLNRPIESQLRRRARSSGDRLVSRPSRHAGQRPDALLGRQRRFRTGRVPLDLSAAEHRSPPRHRGDVAVDHNRRDLCSWSDCRRRRGGRQAARRSAHHQGPVAAPSSLPPLGGAPKTNRGRGRDDGRDRGRRRCARSRPGPLRRGTQRRRDHERRPGARR